ncbi:hypothetical protein C8R44DRAFT_227245 [Mycena epipterygia]|nr:hypothetical protein C8R44DRAFT_227245 [Mycena epipterygia]
MPRPSSWLTITMWAASAVGLRINMTSPDPLPAGGTVAVVWAQDNATANPSQFSLYIVPEGPQENVVDAQLVNAGSQLSGTVLMVVPPETSPGVYNALAYTGTASPTTSNSPALWGWEFNIVAAVQSGSSSSPSPQQGTSIGTSQSATTSPKPFSSSSSPTDSSQPTSTAALNGTGAPTTVPTAIPPPKHALSVGAIVGIVLGLIFALAGIGLLLLYLRRRRQRVRRYSAPGTNHPLPPSPSFPMITPFIPSPPPMTQVVPSIREKDVPIGSSKSGSSPTVDSPSGSSSHLRSTTTSELQHLEAQHQEALARLEREGQMLRQQQSSNYGDEPPPEYNTL